MENENDIVSYLRAGYPFIWVQTYEEERAIKRIVTAISNQKLQYIDNIFIWDLLGGLYNARNPKKSEEIKEQLLKFKTIDDRIVIDDNLRPLLIFEDNFSSKWVGEYSILILKDFHRSINDIKVIRFLKRISSPMKQRLQHIVFVSPVVEIPVELEKDITVVNFYLPTISELMTLAKNIAVTNKLDTEGLNTRVIEAARGLTLIEAENAFALSAIKEGTYTRKIIEEEKLQVIRRSGLMELYQPVPIEELGGLDNLKLYIQNRKKGFERPDLPRPRGIILVGLPGAGKSLSAKVIASVLEYPLIKLDFGTLKDEFVGNSERKMRQALSLIDAVSPCVVWIDEIEKSFGGVISSNRTDGGVTANMFGYLLTWMQESNSPRYIVATCNDINDLLIISQGALVRRFDDIFFVDLPSESERRDILEIMNRRYGTNISLSYAKRMKGWTGAEIEKFVISSIYDGIESAFNNIKPIYYQNMEVIEKARAWAKLNARYANSTESIEIEKEEVELQENKDENKDEEVEEIEKELLQEKKPKVKLKNIFN